MFVAKNNLKNSKEIRAKNVRELLKDGVAVGTGYWRWDRQAALKKGIEILMTRGIERAICCGSWIRFLSKYVGAPILSLKHRVDKYFSEEAKVLDLEWNEKFLCLFFIFLFFYL